MTGTKPDLAFTPLPPNFDLLLRISTLLVLIHKISVRIFNDSVIPFLERQRSVARLAGEAARTP